MNLKRRIIHELEKYDFVGGVYFDDMAGAKIEINADRTFETASCIKFFILLEFYRQVADGKKRRDDVLEYTASNWARGSGVIGKLKPGTLWLTAKSAAEMMMIISDNTATNMMIDYLGIDNINRTIRDMGLRRTKLLNKIAFDKYSAIGASTPKEYGTTFIRLFRRELFDADMTDEIMDILKRVELNDMIIKYMPQFDLDQMGKRNSLIKFIASKDGELGRGVCGIEGKLKNVRTVGGIISTAYGDYAMSIFIEGFRDRYFYATHPAIEFAAKTSILLFDAFVALKEGADIT